MKPNLLYTSGYIYHPTQLPPVFLIDYPFWGLKNRLCSLRHLRTNQGKSYSPIDLLSPPPNEERSIYDLSPERGIERHKARLEDLKKETLGKGIPITYQDERCSTENDFICEYEDGATYFAYFDFEKGAFILFARIDDF